MPHSQIEWIEQASEPQKTYRRMVVGWQSVLATLNATVLAFNSEYFKRESGPHQGMKEIAIKKLVLGSLREIKPRLDDWYREMDQLGAVSSDTAAEKTRVRNVVARVEKFDDVRNLAFHYGDPIEPTDSLLLLYKEIETWDIEFLNRILRDLVSLGEKLKADALAHCD